MKTNEKFEKLNSIFKKSGSAFQVAIESKMKKFLGNSLVYKFATLNQLKKMRIIYFEIISLVSKIKLKKSAN